MKEEGVIHDVCRRRTAVRIPTKTVDKSGRGSKSLFVIQPPLLLAPLLLKEILVQNLTFLVSRFTTLHVETHDNK
jgi:hypothetical protein